RLKLPPPKTTQLPMILIQTRNQLKLPYRSSPTACSPITPPMHRPVATGHGSNLCLWCKLTAQSLKLTLKVVLVQLSREKRCVPRVSGDSSRPVVAQLPSPVASRWLSILYPIPLTKRYQPLVHQLTTIPHLYITITTTTNRTLTLQ